MESIKELREICQAPRRSADNWHMKHISRKPSIYITWALLHTPITANGATFLYILIGILASLIFTLGSKMSFFVGCLALEFWYIMDMVDGEIARYRKQTSLTGSYFDQISHYIIHPFLFFCIGLGLYNKSEGRITPFVISVIAGYSMAMITVTSDILKCVLFDKIKSGCSGDSARDAAGDIKRHERSVFHRIFSLAHLVCVLPPAMNILFFVSLINLFVRQDLFMGVVFFYSICATAVWILRFFIFIIARKADNEYACLTKAAER